MRIQDIIHPEDAKAMRALKKIPFFDTAVRKIMQYGAERLVYGEHIAQMVRVTSTNKPELYNLFSEVVEACEISRPELYIYNDPQPNAYTFGEKKTIVAVSSGLLELMDREELRSVLAHECGHVVCKHTLYNTMVEILVNISSMTIGISDFLLSPIELGLMYWSRRSEFSADRCSVLIAGEEASQRAMLKLASGMKSIKGDPYQLIEQGKEYQRMSNQSWLDKIQQNGRVAFYSHPQMCIRALELHRWAQSCTYRRMKSVA